MKDMKNLKAVHGTAIYTGGGIYVCIGQLNNGKYFCGSIDYCSVFDADTREINEDEDDLACFWPDWCEKHEIASEELNASHGEIIDMFKDFCKRLDANEEGLTDGYEEFSNYSSGEVYDMIGFVEE